MNCENHKKEVAGIGDMKILAEMIGDLHYEALADFFDELCLKMFKDCKRDREAGKKKLSSQLDKIGNSLATCEYYATKAWMISEPFMTDENPKQGR